MDVSKLTLGEVAKVEELSGLSISAIADDDKPKGLALAALAFVAKRRVQPDFVWNDALSLTFTDAQEILGLGQEADPADPTPAPGDPSEAATPKAAKK